MAGAAFRAWPRSKNAFAVKASVFRVASAAFYALLSGALRARWPSQQTLECDGKNPCPLTGAPTPADGKKQSSALQCIHARRL